MFLQLLANGLVTGSVIAIAAVGVSIVYGILRLVNFAYGDFMAFGALAAYAFNGPLGHRARARRRCSRWSRPRRSRSLLDARRSGGRCARSGAGFMSLFLASIGLALVLRQALLLALRAAAAAPTASTRTRSTCSAASASRRRRSSRS